MELAEGRGGIAYGAVSGLRLGGPSGARRGVWLAAGGRNAAGLAGSGQLAARVASTPGGELSGRPGQAYQAGSTGSGSRAVQIRGQGPALGARAARNIAPLRRASPQPVSGPAIPAPVGPAPGGWPRPALRHSI